jgi:tetratricopeptide (TPR) repeat protein
MNKLFFYLVIFVIFGCSKRDTNPPESTSEDEIVNYASYINKAFAFRNTEDIESAIEYINRIIAKEGESKILSIYYDKAQLLYLQGKYDDALMTINLTNRKIYDIQKAALYISLGDIQKAEIILNNLIIYYSEILKDIKDIKEIMNIAQILKTIYILSSKNINELAKQLILENVLSKEQIDFLINYNTLDKQDIIDSMWPR